MVRSFENSAEITRMLREWSGGKHEALDALSPFVYAELHRQAAGYLRRERVGHTLQTTALIHEAYLKLIDHSARSTGKTARIFSASPLKRCAGF